MVMAAEDGGGFVNWRGNHVLCERIGRGLRCQPNGAGRAPIEGRREDMEGSLGGGSDAFVPKLHESCYSTVTRALADGSLTSEAASA